MTTDTRPAPVRIAHAVPSGRRRPRPHEHIASTPVAKKYREVRKILSAAAWKRVRQTGSHETWENPDGTRSVTVAEGFRHRASRYPQRYAPSHGTGPAAMREYLVIYEQGDGGAWGAHSPDVEGVFALGASREEVEQRMAEALSAHLDYLRDRAQPVPEPHTDAGRIAA